MSRPCKYCGLEGHTTMMCYARPKNRMLSRRALKRVGKYGQKWLKTRAEWIKQNPGPWNCCICGELLTKNTMTLDHKKSRSRNPELRYELSNLNPMCWRDNQDKGSLSLEEYLKKRDEDANPKERRKSQTHIQESLQDGN